MSKDDMCAPLGILTFFSASAKAKLSLMVNALKLSETGLSNVDNHLVVACWGEFTMESIGRSGAFGLCIFERRTLSGVLLQPSCLTFSQVASSSFLSV